jgi:uncharacterized protein (DUF488 family)
MSGQEGGAAPVTTIYTVGHGARDLDTFLSLLGGAGIVRLVDVRTAPGSRKHPQFGKDALAAVLEGRGIRSVWRKELGGFRRARPDSRHTALRSPGFRGYADHMETEEFHRVRAWLVDTSRSSRTAVMCAESLWWRCHRRMLADALTAAGCEVRHLMEGGRQDRHRLHPAARLEGDLPVYDVAEEQPRLLDEKRPEGSVSPGRGRERRRPRTPPTAP